MRNPKITRFTILIVATTLIGFAGVGRKHTAHGAGQDIEQMGEKLQQKTE